MKDKKLACFYMTGELLLEFLKDKTGLPEDAQLIFVAGKKGQPVMDKDLKEFMNKRYPEGVENTIVFIVASNKFVKVPDDSAIPIIELKAK